MSEDSEVTQGESVAITGADNINKARLITIRAALGLEVKGLGRRGRSARTIANELMGTNIRSREATYNAFNAWLQKEHGIEPRPLR